MTIVGSVSLASSLVRPSPNSVGNTVVGDPEISDAVGLSLGGFYADDRAQQIAKSQVPLARIEKLRFQRGPSYRVHI